MKPGRCNSEDATSAKRKKTYMQSPKYVPDDIMIPILARLPVKSLLRFSCVSKTWNALFRTPKFISEHHQMYNSNQNSNSSHLVYMTPREKEKEKEKENDAQTTCTVLGERDCLEKSNFVLPFSRYIVAGYCEGLILIRLRTESDIFPYIWNPLVGILKSIGGGGVKGLPKYTFSDFGFGYAGRSRDYRVLKMTYNFLGRHWLHKVEMYSLAADRWTRIERYCDRPPLWDCILYCSNVFFKGSLYWLAKSLEGKYVIVRFDLDEELFSEIALPPYRRPDILLWRLAVVGGDMLALLHAEQRDDEKLHISAWLLNKESTSWTPQTHHFDLPNTLFFVYITMAAHIVMEEPTTPGVLRRLFIYAYNVNHHEFKLTNLQTCQVAPGTFSDCPAIDESSLIPINKESLFFLDR